MRLPPTAPADDRGLAYGDGVFETLAARDGELLGLERHLRRLATGCARLGFDAPPEAAIRACLAPVAAPPGPGVVKLIVTRGSGGRGYRPPAHPAPGLYAARYPWPEQLVAMRGAGIDVVVLDAQLADAPMLAGIKHLNRLEQVLAAAELARTPGAHEGLVRGADGRLLSGVMSNLFLVRAGQLVTPCLRRCGIDGIIRGAVLELCAAGALPPASVRDVAARELADAEEVFLTNSVRGLLPVRSVGERRLHAPGPVSATAQRALARAGLIA